MRKIFLRKFLLYAILISVILVPFILYKLDLNRSNKSERLKDKEGYTSTIRDNPWKETPSGPNEEIKKKFDQIYESSFWGKKDLDEGGGSGWGSSVRYTKVARDILYGVVKKYNIGSMIDAPCGSAAWIPVFLQNITKTYEKENKEFKYFGVDVVESIIKASQLRFKNYSNWNFAVLDFTQQPLPDNYELIFSRDALQHLPLKKILQALKIYSLAKGAKYLLVGSYIDNGFNRDIKIGDYFPIDLRKPPFGLDKYVEAYDEASNDGKHLLLYDIPNYLSKINFDELIKKL